MKVRQKKLALAMAVFFATAHGLALAQEQAAQSKDQPQKIEKIQVTGSNIKRVDAEGPAPVQVITRQEIERTGANTIGEVLRNISANNAGSFDEQFNGSFAKGSSGVSLRGLGQKSTLTLINGRRMANYAFAQNLQDTFVDLNSIPAGAIERVEILKDGASAIYGSDAIAGVVNIILRHDYQGLEAQGGYARTSDGGGAERKVSLAGGLGDPGRDRFNVLATFDWFKRDAIMATDRDFSRTADNSRYYGNPNDDFRSSASNPGNYSRITGTNPFPNGLTRLPFANCPADRVVFVASVNSNNCLQDNNQYYSLLPETERKGFYTRGTYDFSPALSAFLEAGYNETDTLVSSPHGGIPGTQSRASGQRQVQIRLPVGHPNNPFKDPVDIRYSFAPEVGPRINEVETKTKRIVGGFKGNLNNWDWEVGGTYAKSSSTYNDTGISIPGIIDVVGGGTVQETPSLIRIIANGSYNFINNAGNGNLYDRLLVHFGRKGDSTVKQLDAKISGELMQLPSGPLGLAVGAEYRKEELSDLSDPILASGNILSRGSNSAVGSRNIASAYGEFNIPILKTVEMQTALRTDRYSDYGRSTTPKVAVRWQPATQLLLRASYAEGFRAPTLVENSDSRALAFYTVKDTRRCAINNAYCGSVSTPVTIDGNPNLKPEESKSFVAGFVFEPVRAFSIGLDYYDIRQEQVIGNEDPQVLLDRESSPQYSSRIVRGDPTVDDLQRGAPGAVIGISNPFVNLTEVHTKGLDLDVKSRISAGTWGAFSLGSEMTYVLSYKQPPVSGDAADEYAGSYHFPRFRSVSTLGWEKGSWYASLAANYIGRYKQSASVQTPPADTFIKAWTTLDTQIAWTGVKDLRLTVGVKNLQNKRPPIAIAEAPYPYDGQQSNPKGRFMYANVGYKFR